MKYLKDACEEIDAAMFSGDAFHQDNPDGNEAAANLLFYVARWVNEIGALDLGTCGREDLKLYHVARCLGYTPSVALEAARGGHGAGVAFRIKRGEKEISVWSIREGWQVAWHPSKGNFQDHECFETLPLALMKGFSL